MCGLRFLIGRGIILENSESELKKQRDAGAEIDLVYLFLILWNRKLIIVYVTFVCVLLGVSVCVFLPKVYEISAILEPGRDSAGALLENPQAIRENILGGAYNLSISDQLNVELNVIPSFQVTVPKNTDLIKIMVESSNPELGVEILHVLIQEISDNSKSRLQIKVDNAKNQIKAINLKNKTLNEQIVLLENQSAKAVKKMNELEKGRRQAMTSSGGDAMAVLLYSNELQNSQIYSNNLQMKKSNLEGQRRINDLELSNVELKLLIKVMNINKSPSIPRNAIKPRRLLIVVFSFLLGLVSGIVFAFMMEFINKVRQQKLNSEEAR